MLRRLAATLLFEGLAISALHSLGSRPGLDLEWIDLAADTTRVDDAVASGLRIVALALAYWLLLSTCLYVAARLSDVPSAVRAVRWATLPVVRRMLDRALAMSLTFGTLVAPAQAMAQTSPPPIEQTYLPTAAGSGHTDRPVVVVDENIVIPPGASLPQLEPMPPKDPGGPAELPAAMTLPTHLLFDGPDDIHQVVAGENLWSIAANRLRDVTGSTPSEAATVLYWVELIAANRDAIASGDPDLIYPGETLTLPPVAP